MRRWLLALTLLGLVGCAVNDADWNRAMNSVPQYEAPQRTQTTCVQSRGGILTCY
jgi:hypothetical protein